MHHTRIKKTGPENLLIKAHNEGYPIPIETVFRGKGDPTENRLLQQMLAEFSKFQLGLTIYDTPMDRGYVDRLRYEVTMAPVVMVIEIGEFRHLIEVIDMDDTHFIVRNAYSEGEVVYIPISNLWRDPPKVDWFNDKCQIKNVITFKLPKLRGQELKNLRETVEVVRALADEFVHLPETTPTVEEPECVEEGECALIYKVLELLYGHTNDDIGDILEPCPPLETQSRGTSISIGRPSLNS